MKNHFIIKNIIQQGENKLWAHNKNTRRNPFILISCGVIHIPNLKIQIHKIQVKEFRETFWVDNLYRDWYNRNWCKHINHSDYWERSCKSEKRNCDWEVGYGVGYTVIEIRALKPFILHIYLIILYWFKLIK